MVHFDDTVTLADEPQAIAARLIDACDEFAHLKEADPQLLVLFSQRTLFLHGGQKAAVIVQPRWQGPLGMVAEFLIAQLGKPRFGAALDPDYLVIVDAAIWASLDAERRERLMFHELSHLVAQETEFGVMRRSNTTGKPLLKLAPHDVEIFDAEIVRYGVDVCGVEQLPTVIVEGEARKRRRNLRIA